MGDGGFGGGMMHGIPNENLYGMIGDSGRKMMV